MARNSRRRIADLQIMLPITRASSKQSFGSAINERETTQKVSQNFLAPIFQKFLVAFELFSGFIIGSVEQHVSTV
jgi:hypothetical protein